MTVNSSSRTGIRSCKIQGEELPWVLAPVEDTEGCDLDGIDRGAFYDDTHDENQVRCIQKYSPRRSRLLIP